MGEGPKWGHLMWQFLFRFDFLAEQGAVGKNRESEWEWEKLLDQLPSLLPCGRCRTNVERIVKLFRVKNQRKPSLDELYREETRTRLANKLKREGKHWSETEANKKIEEFRESRITKEAKNKLIESIIYPEEDGESRITEKAENILKELTELGLNRELALERGGVGTSGMACLYV